MVGLAVTAQGKRDKELLDIQERRDGRNNPYFWIGFVRGRHEPGHGTDLRAVAENRISVTPLRRPHGRAHMTLFAGAFAESGSDPRTDTDEAA